MMKTRNAEHDTAGIWRYGELGIALTVIALGFVVLWQSGDEAWLQLPDHTGPRIVPAVIGIVQILIGVWYAAEIVKFHRWGHHPAVPCDTDQAVPESWIPLSVFGLALLAYTLLLHRSGFVIASVLLLVLAAFGMGSRRTLRDLSVAVPVSAAIFLILDTWLGIQLPEGWLAGLM